MGGGGGEGESVKGTTMGLMGERSVGSGEDGDGHNYVIISSYLQEFF